MPWILNPNAAPAGPCPARQQAVIGRAAHRSARAEITSWPGYEPTPLRNQWSLAEQLGLGSVWVKDESGRFGLGSFKALGGAYGVRQVMKERAPEAGALTVTCASDGNHGRAVAWGAMRFGCDAVIYLPAHVTEARAAAIRSFGARVVRVDGEYDDAVARADRDARDNGWTVISDTSYPEYMDIPRVVMVGYTVMVNEVMRHVRASWPTHEVLLPTHSVLQPTHETSLPTHPDSADLTSPPTHVFIQGGVGGLAAAVIGHLWERLGARRPVAVIVEPESADCLLCSARAGRLVPSRGDLHTVMAGLSCREVSPLAWEVVGTGAHAFMTVPEEGIAPLMRRAARGEMGEVFEGGESGVAGLLGLIEVARDEERRRAIGLDGRSRVLVFNTEGATDPELYGRIVGGVITSEETPHAGRPAPSN